MKKIFLLLNIVFTVNTVFSQQTFTKQDFLKKSKTQKTIGWILVGVGIPCIALGGVQVNPNIAGSDNSNSTAFLITGLAAIGTSIPFFIASSKNKKKAMSLSFKNERIQQLYKNSFVYKQTPALILTVPL